MSIRTKTRNRLLLLLAVSVVGGGGLTGAFFVRLKYLDDGALRAREAGMKAVTDGDYAAGLSELGHYLGRFSDKPERSEGRYAEALFNYALSRQKVEEPRLAHLVSAVSLWKRYLDRQPDPNDPQHKEALQDMLDAQYELDWLPEALDTAEDILKAEPKDPKAHAVKAQILLGQRKYPEALAVATAWANANPHNLEAHQAVFQVLTAQDPDHAAENIKKYADERRAANPADPYFELLASVAADPSADLKDKKTADEKLGQAAKLALSAAARDLSDPKLVQSLSRQLDMLWVQSILLGNEKELGLAGKGLELARKSLDAHPEDIEFRSLYALRLLQAGKIKEVESFPAAVTPDNAKADGRLLAIKAFVEFGLGTESKKNGEPLLAAASQCAKKDPALAALCDALRAVVPAPSNEAAAIADLQAALNDPAVTDAGLKAKLGAYVQTQSDDTAVLAALKTLLNAPVVKRADIQAKLNAYFLARAKVWQETCKTAAAKVPGDSLVSYLLAEASLRIGDNDAAAQAYAQTLNAAPAWVNARAKFAQLAFTLHQGEAAVQNADIAHGLAPDDPALLTYDTYVNTWAAAPGQADQIDKAMALFKDLKLRFADRIAPNDRQKIAEQLSRLGKTDDAIQLLTPTTQAAAQGQPSAQSASEKFVLARLYVEQKRFKEAQDLCDLLLQDANFDPNLITYAAGLAGSLGQDAKAREILAKLDTLKLPPGDSDMVWADYYSRHGTTPQQAIASWKAALKANPANLLAWRHLLSFCLLQTGTTEQFDGLASFMTNLSEARKAVPDNAAIKYLAALQDKPGRELDGDTSSLLAEMCADNFVRPLLIALLEGVDDPAGKTITQCLAALAESQKSQDKLISELQKLVDDNPDVLPVQNFLVAFYGLSQRYDQCVAMASRVMRASNDPATPAQTAIRVLNANGRLDEALAVAKEWRQRSPAQPMAADLAIASAYLALRKPADAIAQVTDPYLNDIKQGKKTPDDYADVYATYLQALLNSNQTDAALQAVTPLLGAPRWRNAWIRCLVASPDDKVAAMCLDRLNIPPDAPDANGERVTLAVAWNVMFARTKNKDYEDKAFGLLDSLNGKDASHKEAFQDITKDILASPLKKADGVVLLAHWYFKTAMGDAQKSLQPLLDSVAGRSAWINLASDITDPIAAAQWLDAANDPAAVVNSQKIQLANALTSLALRDNTPAALKTSCLKTAIAILEPLASANESNYLIQVTLAVTYEAKDDYTSAAEVYRRMLKTSTSDARVLNNLANDLAKGKKKEDGPEALTIVAQALKLDPKAAPIYDTQASVYALLMGDQQSALASIQEAISLDPANPEWKVSRIWILCLAGRRDAATAEFNQLKQTQDVGKLSLDSRQRLKEAGLQ